MPACAVRPKIGTQDAVFFRRLHNRRARAALLAAQGIEVAATTPESVDYKSLQDDLGAFYRTRWSDRLQSFLVELPTITKLFPTEAGHQDLDTLANLWLGEFSQPDNSPLGLNHQQLSPASPHSIWFACPLSH